MDKENIWENFQNLYADIQEINSDTLSEEKYFEVLDLMSKVENILSSSFLNNPQIKLKF